MEIVIEQTLMISIFLNYFILKMTSRIVGEKARLVFISSKIGGLISLITPIWHLNALLKICLMICVAFIMILISFKYKSIKQFFTIFTIFMFSTFIFGGASFALQEIFGQFPIFIIAIIASVVYIIFLFITKIVGRKRKKQNFTYNLTIKDGDKMIDEEGYLDSGNVLYDTLTNKPIVLVTYDVFHKLYEDISLVSLLTKDFATSAIKNAHYLKVKGIGKGGSMLIFTVDQIQISVDEREFKNVSLGLSFSGFEKSFGKNVLLHCDFS